MVPDRKADLGIIRPRLIGNENWFSIKDRFSKALRSCVCPKIFLDQSCKCNSEPWVRRWQGSGCRSTWDWRVNKCSPILQQGLDPSTISVLTYSWRVNIHIFLCPCCPLNSVFFLLWCLPLMYFWRRVTYFLSTYLALLNKPFSSSLPPWDHFVTTQSPQPISLYLLQCEYLLDPSTGFEIPYHFLPLSCTEAPIFSCFYGKYLSPCIFKMHLLFSRLRKNPLLWFTIILRWNTALQSLPPPFQYTGLNIYISIYYTA